MNQAHSSLSLAPAWRALLDQRGPLRIRAAADALGVSEFELRSTQIGCEEEDTQVVRLAGEWPELIEGLPALGEVMALTRNDAAVHEKVGRYAEISFTGGFGLVLNHDIDLRLFLRQWIHAVAVVEPGKSGAEPRASLHFFNGQGTAIHKIYLREGSSRPAFDAIVARFTAEDQSPGVRVEPPAAEPEPVPDETIDAPSFQADWLALTDTHDFFPMLRRHGVARTQALRLAPEHHAWRVPSDSVVTILERAAATETPIMVFVGSPGCIQIHTGPVERVVPTGPWINVLDPGFNLHLRTDAVAEAWIVRKPTADGIVSSLELFDSRGQIVAQLFGARKPGVSELEPWRELLAELPASI